MDFGSILLIAAGFLGGFLVYRMLDANGFTARGKDGRWKRRD